MKIPKNEHSIRNKLLMTMIGLIIVLVALSTITQILAQKQILEKESNLRIDLMKDKLADRGETLVISLTDQVRNKMATVNLSLLPEILRKAIADDKDLKYAILMDFNRTAYIHTAMPELEQEILDSPEDLYAARQIESSVHEYEKGGQSYIEYIEPIQISMEPWGLLRLGFTLKHLNEEIFTTKQAILTQTRIMILRSLITASIFILLGIFIVVLVSNKLSSPLMTLTRLANALAKGNFSAARKIKPGSTYEINVLANALVDMSSKLKKSYGELEDYSHTLEQKVKIRTNQLEEARDEAISANKSKSEFLSIVSHEIRTPMNAILGISRLLTKTELSDKQQDYLNKIQVSANILLSIIKDILDFSKIEAGKLEIEQVEFNLKQVLDHLSSLVSFDALEKGLSFNVSIAKDVPMQLIGDSMRLLQVLLNLANNAVKFTDSGEINVCVSAKDQQTPEVPVTLRFSIQDTGIGLSREQTARLFQPFTQADVSTTRRYGGTGMGLAVCKRLVELMGGAITVRSELNEGSVFSFTAQFKRRANSFPTAANIADALYQLHAVVLEQDADNRKLICTYLNSWQITTTVVANVHQAIEKFTNWKADAAPQLLLLGETTAQQADFSTAQIITNAVRNTRLKIFMMCEVPKQTDFEQDQQCVDRILNKPVNASLLLDAMMDLCIDSSQQSAPLTESGLPDVKGVRLLLVEDQLINQLVAKEFLQHAGFTVSIADNGKKALELLQKNVYSAVIMDLQMPVLDGFETTRLIRANHKFADLPIIAMTAHVMTGEKEKCLQAGMNDYIAKPIDEEKLHETLGKWIKPASKRNESQNLKDLKSPSIEMALKNISGMDIEQGLKNFTGNQILLVRLLHEFNESFADYALKIKACLQASDMQAATQQIHAIKGVVDVLGLVDMQNCLTNLSNAIKHRENVSQAFDELELTLSLVVKSISQLPELQNQTELSPTPLQKTVEELLLLMADLVRHNLRDSELYLQELASLSEAPNFTQEVTQLSLCIERFDYKTAYQQLKKIARLVDVDLDAPNSYSRPPDKRQKLLIVDDFPIIIRFLIETLIADYNIAVTLNSEEAIPLSESDEPPDLIVMDVEMPGQNGYQICRRLKENSQTRKIPVIFITGRNNSHDETFGLEAGAVDYITKPFSPAVVNARIETQLKIKKQSDLLKELISRDALTNIPNRRKFDSLLKNEWYRAQRRKKKLTLIFIDVDYFKGYNDHYGHSQGDQCLIKIAETLQATLRCTTGTVTRYGGEEFVAILPEIGCTAGVIKAEEMRQKVYALNISHSASEAADRVTISLGVAEIMPEPGIQPETLLKMADEAVYAAKKDGRNRVFPNPAETSEAPGKQSGKSG